MNKKPHVGNECEPPWTFHTPEAIEATEKGRLLEYYLRLHDPLCATALSTHRTAADQRAVLKIFPFIRNTAVLQFPLTHDRIGIWLRTAFYAGFMYGKQYPAQAEDISEQTLGGHDNSRRRLLVVAKLLEQVPPEFSRFRGAFNAVAPEWKTDPGESHEQSWVRMALVATLMGFGAATEARHDPDLAEFVGQLTIPISLDEISVLDLVLVRSLIVAEERPVGHLVTHPLLALADVHYPTSSFEKRTILPFFHKQLALLGIRSENECPVEDADLTKWINAGLEYGKGLLIEQPHVVQQILGACTPDHLTNLKNLASQLTAPTGQLDSYPPLAAFLWWHKDIYDWYEPEFYGQALMRAIRLADLAVWLPWLVI